MKENQSLENNIQYFVEDVDFELPNKKTIASWIIKTIQSENGKLGFINFIYCSDEYLLGINQQYLNHDTYTDIITFDYSSTQIESDIFISIDRIKENAVERNLDFEIELHRIMIHGILHLLGYGDKTKKDKELMTEKENAYLTIF